MNHHIQYRSFSTQELNNGIKSRLLNNINPYIDGICMLPLIVSADFNYVSESNWETFYRNKLLAIIPTSVPIKTRLTLVSEGIYTAFTFDEFKKHFGNPSDELIKCLHHIYNLNIYLDNVNGHVRQVYKLISQAKLAFKAFNHLYRLFITVPNIYDINVYKDIKNLKYPVDFTVLEHTAKDFSYKPNLDGIPKIITVDYHSESQNIAFIINKIFEYESFCIGRYLFSECLDVACDKYVYKEIKGVKQYRKISYEQAERLIKKGVTVYNKVEPIHPATTVIDNVEHPFFYESFYSPIKTTISQLATEFTYWLKVYMFYSGRSKLNINLLSE